MRKAEQQHKSLFWKAVSELGQDFIQTTVRRAIRGSGEDRCPPSPAVLGLNITSGTTSKTKSESVSVVHGCQRLKGRPQRTSAVARRLWPSIDATATDEPLPPLLFDLVSPEKWVSSSVHHNDVRGRGQGERLLRC